MNLPGRFIVSSLSLAVALTTCGCKTMQAPKLPKISTPAVSPDAVVENIEGLFKGPPPNREIALASFSEGEKIFESAAALAEDRRTGAFRKAIDPYKRAAEHAPNTTIEEDALMMVAETHFFADEYVKAATGYDALIKKYPRTRHLDRIDQRRFAISQYWLGLTKKSSATSWLPNFTDKQRPATDTFGFATKNLDKIRFDNPTGKLADDATMAAGIAKFQKRKFGQADILFADIRDNFPSSEHQFQAHLLGLKCKQAMYRGADYSGVVLDQAEEIIKKMYRLFPEQAAEHNESLQEAFKDIRLKQASREYSMAEYYDGRSEFGAASMYYDNVRREYKDTNLAVESEGRVAAISKFAPTPPNSLKWLADLFPKEEGRAKPLFHREAVGVAK